MSEPASRGRKPSIEIANDDDLRRGLERMIKRQGYYVDPEYLPREGCMWMLTRQDMVIRETIPPASARPPSERGLGSAEAVGKNAGRSRA
jgi:hypothetical protein